MLRINKGEPWIMWPNKRVENFIDFPANNIFNHDGDFSIRIDFELINEVNEYSTLFSKLPSYCGVNIEKDNLHLILTYNDKEIKHVRKSITWITNKIYKLEIFKKGIEFTLYLDDILFMSISDSKSLLKSENSHIIFGAGNFPSNGFNLNYLDVNLHYLEITKDKNVISKHEFNEYIYDKSLDLSDNCNFIHKI